MPHEALELMVDAVDAAQGRGGCRSLAIFAAIILAVAGVVALWLWAA